MTHSNNSNLESSQPQSKTIAKNTLFLYFRMLVTMAIGIYTSRVVLQQLGVDDYGIYNVVGGFVSMFAIISASLSTAISRFLTFELGKGHEEKLRSIFSTAVIIQGGLSVIIVLLVESFGLWFVNSEMNISPDRLTAANWVLQCSLIAFVFNMISVPYNACIIAHERMQAFAYISLLEAGFKLGVAFLLFLPVNDPLILYAILITVVSVIIRQVYWIYCKRHFPESRMSFKVDKEGLKEMLSFSGWNFIGSSSGILKDQGVNVLMNIFCGPAINAARGLAVQVNNVVYSFCSNFLTAVNPQIVKTYAKGEIDRMLSLVRRSSKFAFYLLFIISLPLILEAPFVLDVWLTTVPERTVGFVRLILILALSESLSLPLQYANQATGNIKLYQICVGGLQLLNFPISYILLYAGIEPESTFVVAICISQVALAARLLILRKSIGLSIREFFCEVYLPVIVVIVIAVPIPWIAYYMINMQRVSGFFMVCMLSLCISIAAIWLVGLNRYEKSYLKEKIKKLNKRTINPNAKN